MGIESQSAAIPNFPMERTCPYLPPPGYGELRANGPISRVKLYDGSVAWLVSGHSEARSLLTNPGISADPENPGYPFLNARRRAVLGQRTLVTMDPPEHSDYRRILIPAFTGRRVAQMRPVIEEIVDDLLENMLRQGPPAELMSSFALPVPSMVICQVLGIPVSDRAFFENQTQITVKPTTTPEEAGEAFTRLREYLADLLVQKQRTPGEGLLDDLLSSQVNGRNLNREEIVSLALLVLVAGHETTASMIGLGTLTLLEYPDQIATLRGDMGLMSSAVEELLRFLAIADTMTRVATEDIEIANQVIRAGDGVILAGAAINRDKRIFESPDDLDVSRPGRQHHTFGFGVHQCLGQNLARLEMEIAFKGLLSKMPTLKVTVPVESLAVKPAGGGQGIFELPITW
nr:MULTISPECIES: cytochrome P450 [unclassified Streptomyces]